MSYFVLFIKSWGWFCFNCSEKTSTLTPVAIIFVINFCLVFQDNKQKEISPLVDSINM